jgi:hypothetical protein
MLGKMTRYIDLRDASRKRCLDFKDDLYRVQPTFSCFQISMR